MARYRKKIKWKNLLSGALCLLLVVGAVMGITTLTGKDTIPIRSTAFSVGGINDDGNYVKTDTSIYTKDMFECQGLTIEPDFEATGTYQVFYYDSNKNFIGATEVMNAEDGVYTKADTFTLAQYARIMITPAVPVDEDAEEDEAFRIRFYEVTSYAGDYTITVDKKQKFGTFTDNLYVVKKGSEGKYYKDNLNNFAEMGSYVCSDIIDVAGYSKVIVLCDGFSSDAIAQLHLASNDTSKTILETVNLTKSTMIQEGDMYCIEVTLADDVSYAAVSGIKDVNYLVYAMK